MKPNPDNAWQPDPEQLAAYLDGELEGRDKLQPLRTRIEKWLADNPSAHEEVRRQRRLRELWQRTTPSEPSTATWNQVWNRINRPPQPAQRLSPWKTALWLSGLAACLLIAWNLRPVTAPVPELPVVKNVPEEVEIFSVATADEIQILRVEGKAYTNALVVGELPLQGPMQLLEKDEVTFTSVHPNFRFGRERPLLWAKLETED